jgi:zinc transport system permease protein
MDNFILNAIIAGIGIALISGLLGCFVIWRKMSYFGDSLGHSAVLGIGLGIIIGINYNISIIAVIILFSILLTYIQSKGIFSNDAILGILAHGALSIGIILISLSDAAYFDLHSFLFGNILIVSRWGILSIFLVVAIVYVIIITNWKALILSTISRDLARSNGINTTKMDLLLTISMALTIAVSIQIIGVLLITSMLIIPAATSRQIVSGPKNMAIISILIALLSVLVGILCSYNWDIPTGPAIIAISFILFFIVFLLKRS